MRSKEIVLILNRTEKETVKAQSFHLRFRGMAGLWEHEGVYTVTLIKER